MLANIYMRRFLKAWERRGNERKLGSRIVNYADDFVILCRGRAREALAEAEGILTRVGLTLNRDKTRICCPHETPFEFLGYSFGVQYGFGGGQKYLAAYPSVESVRRLKAKLRRMIGSHLSWVDEAKLVGDVNRVLRGWTNYFSYGSLWKAYVKLEKFIQQRIRGWLVHKHRVEGRGECRFPVAYIYGTLGLVNLARLLSPSRTP